MRNAEVRMNLPATRAKYRAKINQARERVKELRAKYNGLGPNWQNDIREIQHLEVNIEGWKRVLDNLDRGYPSHGFPVPSSNVNLVIQR